jgi:photosystem II stability/assembly factor-like uncharacterized protein
MKISISVAVSTLMVILAGESRGEGWQFVEFEGKEIHSIALHPENPDIIFVKLEDCLCRSQDGGSTWDSVGYLTCVTFDPRDFGVIYAILGGDSRGSGIWRSVDGGDNWDAVMYGFFGTSIAVATWPRRAIVMAGFEGEGAYRSDDTARTWYAINDSLNLNVLSLATTDANESASVFLAGTEGGIYSRYADHWVYHGPSSNLPVLSITNYSWIRPTLYAAIGNGSWSDGIYESADDGRDWTVSAYWLNPKDVLMNSLDSLTVYAASSSQGVIMTRDGAENWDSMNEGLADTAVFCLGQSRADTSKLYAGTRTGLYVYDSDVSIEESEAPASSNKPFLLLNPVVHSGSSLEIRYWIPAESSNTDIDLRIYSLSGRLITILSGKQTNQGWNSVVWRSNNRSGILIVRLKVGNEKASQKVVLL